MTGVSCGRPLWDQDSAGRCYFHSDGSKEPEEFYRRLTREVELLEEDEEPGPIDFSSFVFPDFRMTSEFRYNRQISLAGSRFLGKADFSKIHYSYDIDFAGVKFLGTTDFSRAEIGHGRFQGAIFEGPCSFEEALFQTGATFDGALFRGEVRFNRTKFQLRSSFGHVKFLGKAEFSGASFEKVYFVEVAFREADFSGSRFAQYVEFKNATFGGWCDFDGTSIERGSFTSCRFGWSYFGNCIVKNTTFFHAFFGGSASFLKGYLERVDLIDSAFKEMTSFKESRLDGVRFEGVDFHSSVDFGASVFTGFVSFERSTEERRVRFLDQLEMAEVRFEATTLFAEVQFDGMAVFRASTVVGRLAFIDVIMNAGAVLDLRYQHILDREGVQFIGLRAEQDLSRVRLLHVDVRRIWFYNVRWGPEGRVLDEADYLDAKAHATSARNQTSRGGSDIGHLEILYRNLRVNFDDQSHYDQAGMFFVREMEMKRLALGRFSKSRLWRWSRQNVLSIHAAYRALSNYGESYARSGAWAIGSILIFALVRSINLSTSDM